MLGSALPYYSFASYEPLQRKKCIGVVINNEITLLILEIEYYSQDLRIDSYSLINIGIDN